MADFAPLESPKLISRKICAVWKCQNLPITQILHENNLGDFRSTKAILTLLEALDFDLREFLNFWKAEIYQID